MTADRDAQDVAREAATHLVVSASCHSYADSRRIVDELAGMGAVIITSTELARLREIEAASKWRPADTAPCDGDEFLGLLSNGWQVVMSAKPNARYFSWWRVPHGISVPIERTHPADTAWTSSAIRLKQWRPLPSPPQDAAS